MSENGTVAAAEETDSSTTAETTNNETAAQTAEETAQTSETASAPNTEDISYHAVEKEGSVTAIWEMQGQKHIRTIDPRSAEGKQILALFETAA